MKRLSFPQTIVLFALCAVIGLRACVSPPHPPPAETGVFAAAPGQTLTRAAGDTQPAGAPAEPRRWRAALLCLACLVVFAASIVLWGALILSGRAGRQDRACPVGSTPALPGLPVAADEHAHSAVGAPRSTDPE